MLKHLMPSESRECCTLLPTDIADYSVIVTAFHSVIWKWNWDRSTCDRCILDSHWVALESGSKYVPSHFHAPNARKSKSVAIEALAPSEKTKTQTRQKNAPTLKTSKNNDAPSQLVEEGPTTTPTSPKKQGWKPKRVAAKADDLPTQNMAKALGTKTADEPTGDPHIGLNLKLKKAPVPTCDPLLRSDFIHLADTLDCPFSFLFFPHHWSPVRYDTISCLQHLLRVRFDLVPKFMYDINLRATTTTILSTRGVTIPIDLVSSATDSIKAARSTI